MGRPRAPRGHQQNSGCHRKEARAGIIPKNIYSYCLLSTYCLPKTVQVLFVLSIFWSSQWALVRMGTKAQRSQVTCPTSHASQCHRQELNTPSSDLIVRVSRDLSKITERSPARLLFHNPQPHPHPTHSLDNRGWFCSLWYIAPLPPSMPFLGPHVSTLSSSSP